MRISLLKPEMYGEVEFQTGGGRRLVVPQTAMLNSGDRQVVFVDRGKGYFEPREVKPGARSDGTRGNPRGPEGRRAHRDLRQLPDRFGKPVEDRPRRGDANDRPHHRVLGAQPVPGLPVRGRGVAGRAGGR